MTGLFFTDVAAAASGNAAIGVRPGNDGLAGVGILDIEQVPGSRVFTVILTNGRRIPVQISEGLPGVSPILVGGSVVGVAAGAPLSAKVNKVTDGVYSIDLSVPAGPVPFLQPVAWAAGVAYTAVLPASAVVYGRSSYVCIVSHTSAAPFDPTKWVLIAGGGIDGTGTMNGPSAATSGVVAVFDGPSGGKVKEGPAIGTAAGNLVALNASGELPAVSAKNLTNIPGGIPDWTQIQVVSISSAQATVDFFAISQAYKELKIEAFDFQISQSSSIQISDSADGTTFSPGANIANPAAPAINLNFIAKIEDYTKDRSRGILSGAFVSAITSPGVAANAVGLFFRSTGGLKNLRLLLAAGVFTAGTFTLYAR